MSRRFIAVTHGDPQNSERCGRPLHVRPNEDGPNSVYVCPIHGDIRETKGPTAPFAYWEEDVRKRQAYE